MSNLFCHQCGASISRWSSVCASCGAPVNQTFEYTYEKKPIDSSLHSLYEGRKNPVLAAIASLLWTGMGQVYNGNLLRGLGFLFGALIGSIILIYPGILIWLYGIYDAYRTAKQMNDGEISYTEYKLSEIIIFVLVTIGIIVGIILLVGYLFWLSNENDKEKVTT